MLVLSAVAFSVFIHTDKLKCEYQYLLCVVSPRWLLWLHWLGDSNLRYNPKNFTTEASENGPVNCMRSINSETSNLYHIIGWSYLYLLKKMSSGKHVQTTTEIYTISIWLHDLPWYEDLHFNLFLHLWDLREKGPMCLYLPATDAFICWMNIICNLITRWMKNMSRFISWVELIN